MIQRYIDKLTAWIRGFFDKDKEKQAINPEKNWYLIIIIFFLASVLLIMFYYFVFSAQFLNVGEADASQNVLPPEFSVEKITKENLGKIISVWNVKGKKFDDYYKNKPDFDILK